MKHAVALLEREDQMEVLLGCVTAAKRGDGKAVALVGEPGSGKTELLRGLVTVASGEEIWTCRARGAELESAYPLGVARQLLGPLVRRDRDLLAGPGRAAGALLTDGDGDAADAQTLAFALHALVAEAAEGRPMLLVVDDAHWADGPSCRWLAQVARDLPGSAVSLVFATRGSDPGAAAELAELRSVPSLRETAVPVLTGEGVRLLVRRREPDADGAFCEACATATGGNPLLMRAVLDALSDEGAHPTVEAATRLLAAPPPTVAVSVMVRVSRLGRAASDLAHAVAVLERDVALSHAAALAGLDLAAASTAADDLTRSGILTGERELSFVHPLMRAAVHEDIAPATRREHHRHAAELLDAGGALAEKVAAHLMLTHPAGDARAVEILGEAARAALERGAPDVAAVLLARALEEPPPPADRMSVAIAHIVAEDASGRPPEPLLDRLIELLRTASPPELSSAFARTEHLPIRAGRIPEALALVDEMIGRLAPDAREDRLGLEWNALQLCGNDVTLQPDGRARGDLLVGMLSGGSPLEQRLLREIAWWRAHTGRPCADSQALFDRAGDVEGEGAEAAHEHLCIAQTRTLLEQWEPAREAFDAALVCARRAGSVPLMYSTLGYRGVLEHRIGNLRAAEADLAGALDLAAGRPYEAALAGALLAAVVADRGRLDEAVVLTDRARADLHGLAAATIPGLMAAHSIAEVDLATGKVAAAADDIRSIGERLNSGGAENHFSKWRVTLSIAYGRLGRADEARAQAQTELRWAESVPAPLSVASARLAAALADGRPEPEALGAAVAAAREAGSPLALARALVEYGAALRRAKARAAAREPLSEGLDLAARCGAEPLAARAREELAATGARPRRDLRSGLDALTPSEMRVARLAAANRSNPQIAQELFITRRTVETHISSIFLKLGLTSRDGIAPLLAD